MSGNFSVKRYRVLDGEHVEITTNRAGSVAAFESAVERCSRRPILQKSPKRREGTPAPRRGVVLTLRQAELLVRIARTYHLKPGCGLTPGEKLLVGAAARRVEKAKKGNH